MDRCTTASDHTGMAKTPGDVVYAEALLAGCSSAPPVDLPLPAAEAAAWALQLVPPLAALEPHTQWQVNFRSHCGPLRRFLADSDAAAVQMGGAAAGVLLKLDKHAGTNSFTASYRNFWGGASPLAEITTRSSLTALSALGQPVYLPSRYGLDFGACEACVNCRGGTVRACGDCTRCEHSSSHAGQSGGCRRGAGCCAVGAVTITPGGGGGDGSDGRRPSRSLPGGRVLRTAGVVWHVCTAAANHDWARARARSALHRSARDGCVLPIKPNPGESRLIL